MAVLLKICLHAREIKIIEEHLSAKYITIYYDGTPPFSDDDGGGGRYIPAPLL